MCVCVHYNMRLRLQIDCYTKARTRHVDALKKLSQRNIVSRENGMSNIILCQITASRDTYENCVNMAK